MLLLASAFFLTLLQCSDAQNKASITPADCNTIERDAAVALDLVNRHRRDGYIFGLFRVADAHELHIGNSSLQYLTLDVLETECSVLSRRHWESCEYGHTYTMDFGQCKIITCTSQLLKKPQLYGFNCTLSPVPPDLLECKDCPVKIETLEVTEQHKNLAAKTLEKFNSKVNYTNFFNVDKVEKILKLTASREGYTIEFSVKETNCSKSTQQEDQALECDFLDDWHAHVGFCKARTITDPEQPDATDINCEIYEPSQQRSRHSAWGHPHRHPHSHHHFGHGHHHKHGCPPSSQSRPEDPENSPSLNEEHQDSNEGPASPPPHHGGPHHHFHHSHHCPPPPPHDEPHPPSREEPYHPPSTSPPHDETHNPALDSHHGPHCPPPPPHDEPHPPSREEPYHPPSTSPPHDETHNPALDSHHGPHCPPPPHGPHHHHPHHHRPPHPHGHHHHPPPHCEPHCPPPPPHGPHHHHPPPHCEPPCPPPPPHGPHHHHPPPHCEPHCPPPPPHGPHHHPHHHHPHHHRPPHPHGHHHHPPPHCEPHCPPPPPHGPHHHHPPPHCEPHCPPPPPHGPHHHHPPHHCGPHHPPPPGHPPHLGHHYYRRHCNKTGLLGKHFPFQITGAVYRIPVLNQLDSLTPPTVNFPELFQSNPHSSSTGEDTSFTGSSVKEMPEAPGLLDHPTPSKSCPGNPKFALPKILPLFPHSSMAENSAT
ncbi:PREDICTED: histidine-rich glycoprotein [Buceros rhinoceros silvestris]|uniref:histidine-rich glycoprotein n=1 Tax=Buceros rhinoceros silvestris TaxID=175836 RepID=UPI00052810F1|nr:PREDICTED: histidine-rich glycoprotein [Buceros rhinoceros silvestris]